MMELLMILGMFWLNCQKVRADDQTMGITVSPAMTEIDIGPTDSQQSFKLTLENRAQTETTLKLSVVDFGSLDESGGVAFLGMQKQSIEGKYSLASWLSLSNETVIVAAGGTQTVTVSVLNKESLSPGGHYGAVLMTMNNEAGGNQPRVSIRQSDATLIFVKKTGGEVDELDLNRVDFSRAWWRLPATVNLRFQNSGNVHLIPRGKIEIYDSRGQMAAKGMINGESTIILPESFKKYPVKIFPFSFWLGPGKYLMTVSYRYDGKDDFAVQEIMFNYFGWQWVVLCSVILGGTAVIMAIKFPWLRRKLNR